MAKDEKKRKWAKGALWVLGVLLTLALTGGLVSMVHKAQRVRDLSPFVGVYRFDSVHDAGASKVGDLVKMDILDDGLVARVENQVGDVHLRQLSEQVFVVDPPGYQVLFLRSREGKVIGMSPRPNQVKFDFTLTKLEGTDLEAVKDRKI